MAQQIYQHMAIQLSWRDSETIINIKCKEDLWQNQDKTTSYKLLLVFMGGWLGERDLKSL